MTKTVLHTNYMGYVTLLQKAGLQSIMEHRRYLKLCYLFNNAVQLLERLTVIAKLQAILTA